MTIINLSWALISTLVFPTFISDETLGFSNSIFSIFLFAGIYAVLRKTSEKPTNKRSNVYSHILGLLLSFMIAIGHALDAYGDIPFRKIFVSIILYTHILAALVSLFWKFLIDAESKVNLKNSQKKVAVIIEKVIIWIVQHPYMIVVFLLLCWLPCFIADFPGGFRYDAMGELYQIKNGYNGNYPLLHSVIITRLLPFCFNLTGSYNTGIAVYVTAQMIMISCMYAHIIYTFWKKGINEVILLVLLLYCGFFPVIQIMVVQEVRDVLFSALLMYAMFLFYLMAADKETFFSSFIKPLLLGVVFVLALLARNNNAGKAMLFIIVVVSAVIWAINRKQYFRGATIFGVTSIASYLILGAILTALCQPLTPANIGGSLSIMSQPIIRAYLYENESWSDEEITELGKYINLDGITYCAENADLTKSRVHIQDNFGDFFKFWTKIGFKHPGCYLDAILANTQNMWYPDSVIDGYNQIFKEEGQPYSEYEKCYFSIHDGVEEPARHMNLWPKALNYYTQIGLFISFEKIPIVSMFFSIGFQFWIIFNSLFYVIYRKIKKLILPIAIILGYMLISACVPLILVRYFAAAFFAFPILLTFMIQPNRL